MEKNLLTAKAVFDHAHEISALADRNAYLDQACADAPDLREKVLAVDGVPKRQRRGSVAAVQFGGAPVSVSGSREDGGFSLYLLQLHREVQECDPTWSFGKRFVGWC